MPNFKVKIKDKRGAVPMFYFIAEKSTVETRVPAYVPLTMCTQCEKVPECKGMPLPTEVSKVEIHPKIMGVTCSK